MKTQIEKIVSILLEYMYFPFDSMRCSEGIIYNTLQDDIDNIQAELIRKYLGHLRNSIKASF